jgi:hypothetical protein
MPRSRKQGFLEEVNRTNAPPLRRHGTSKLATPEEIKIIWKNKASALKSVLGII